MAWTSFIDTRYVDQEIGGNYELIFLGFGHPLPQLHGAKIVHVVKCFQLHGTRLIHVVTTKLSRIVWLWF